VDRSGVVRLRKVIENEERLDLLKLDIEGAELDVLKDCSDVLCKVENVFVEYHAYHRGNRKLGDLLSILEKSGFNYYLKPVSHVTKPFVNMFKVYPLQVNVFATREK